MSTTHQKPNQLIIERINKTRRQVRTVELVTLVACLLAFLLVSEMMLEHAEMFTIRCIKQSNGS